MAKVQIEIVDPGRFPGDFQVHRLPPAAALAPEEVAAENAYFGRLRAVLDEFGVHEQGDETAGYAAAALADMKARRQAAVAELRAQAERFSDGGLAAQDAAAGVSAVETSYAADRDALLPAFQTVDRAPARFDGDFRVQQRAGRTADDAERVYLNGLNSILAEMDGDERADLMAQYAMSLLVARQKRRSDAADELRADANRFCAGELPPKDAAEMAFVSKGKYIADRERLSRELFSVFPLPHGILADNVEIQINPGLPPPNDKPPPEKEKLYNAFESTQTVIKTVCKRIKDGADTWFNRNFFPKYIERESERADWLLDEFIRKLAGIAGVGLAGPHSQLAALGLDALRNEFVAQQAGRIKNAYVRRLGYAAGAAAALCLGFYALIRQNYVTASFWADHRNFLVAAGGAAIGTWLSFSIRRPQLTFDDLAVLEEDLLDPGARVVFVIALTMMACLLFWTGAINLEIGNLKTRAEVFASAGSTALLVGLFCGVAERALAPAVSARAGSFVRGIAGGG
jgi:hypothetical protein